MSRRASAFTRSRRKTTRSSPSTTRETVPSSPRRARTTPCASMTRPQSPALLNCPVASRRSTQDTQIASFPSASTRRTKTSSSPPDGTTPSKCGTSGPRALCAASGVPIFAGTRSTSAATMWSLDPGAPQSNCSYGTIALASSLLTCPGKIPWNLASSTLRSSAPRAPTLPPVAQGPTRCVSSNAPRSSRLARSSSTGVHTASTSPRIHR
mmetsp:Transcript_4027/g.11424  ORF Transcript_4027/g.11424 Transcript_4027/m.11424 type:complete len:210 (+) Transcript_4027:432-1061(+)